METSASLLDRLCRAQPDPASWQRLVDLYTPLIRGWLARLARLDHEADDVTQDVLAVVVRKLPQFRRNQRTGAFRKWLRTITVNCLHEFWRARRSRPVSTGDSNFLQMLDQLEDPHSRLSRLWDREHDQRVADYLLEQIKPEFKPNSWLAFQRVFLENVPVERVAAELKMTPNAVYIARSRVLGRLRQEGRGLIE